MAENNQRGSEKGRRVAAYIPARLGSNRVAAKNLRLLNDKPLVQHALETARTAASLSEVYLNTESEQIADVGRRVGARIHLRAPDLAVSATNTDDILYDFAKAVECDSIAVINPTAPFLSAASIDAVVAAHVADPERTILSTNQLSKHLIVGDQPVNFRTGAPSPRTQDLEPFQYINFLIFVISRDKVIRGFEHHGFCLYDPPIAFFPLGGIETHDIDDEADFLLAELYLRHREDMAARFDPSIAPAMAAGFDFRS